MRDAKEVAAAVCFAGEGPSLDWAKGVTLIERDRIEAQLALLDELRRADSYGEAFSKALDVQGALLRYQLGKATP